MQEQMTPEIIETVRDALEFQRGKLESQLAREPRTRKGKPNAMREYLKMEIAKIGAAQLAFQRSESTAVQLDHEGRQVILAKLRR